MFGGEAVSRGGITPVHSVASLYSTRIDRG